MLGVIVNNFTPTPTSTSTPANPQPEYTPRPPQRWSREEDTQLVLAVEKHGPHGWKALAKLVPGRSHAQCLQRWQKVLRPGLKKGSWSSPEDACLGTMLLHGGTNWTEMAQKIPGRTSKQCRERWFNHLDPSINRDPYTSAEDTTIMEIYNKMGSKWSNISKALTRVDCRRTPESVKLRCHGLLKHGKKKKRKRQPLELLKQPTPKQPKQPKQPKLLAPALIPNQEAPRPQVWNQIPIPDTSIAIKSESGQRGLIESPADVTDANVIAQAPVFVNAVHVHKQQAELNSVKQEPSVATKEQESGLDDYEGLWLNQLMEEVDADLCDDSGLQLDFLDECSSEMVAWLV